MGLQGITGHEGAHLFLNPVRGNDEIIDVHRRLYGGELSRHLDRKESYLPHMTLGWLPDEKSFREAVDSLAGHTELYETVVGEVALATCGDDGWRVDGAIPLQGKG